MQGLTFNLPPQFIDGIMRYWSPLECKLYLFIGNQTLGRGLPKRHIRIVDMSRYTGAGAAQVVQALNELIACDSVMQLTKPTNGGATFAIGSVVNIEYLKERAANGN